MSKPLDIKKITVRPKPAPTAVMAAVRCAEYANGHTNLEEITRWINDTSRASANYMAKTDPLDKRGAIAYWVEIYNNDDNGIDTAGVGEWVVRLQSDRVIVLNDTDFNDTYVVKAAGE